jgi:thiamine-phosphate pyrophosphorylase
MAQLQGLYGITDSQLMADQTSLLEKVEASLRGGLCLLQYRDKSDDAAKRLADATALADLCKSYHTPLLINDDVELAKQSGAQGVHLGQSDGSLTQAREYLGSNAILGATCHDSLALAEKAKSEGANYLAFGAFFRSNTKPNASPAPLSLLHEAHQSFDLPLVAIGGLTLDNAQQVIHAGAQMIAVIHALYAQQAIEQQARAFNACFSSN